MTFDQFKAMLQDMGLKVTNASFGSPVPQLKVTPERALFEKMMRAHADNLGRLARNAMVGSMGGDEEVSLCETGPWSRDTSGDDSIVIRGLEGTPVAKLFTKADDDINMDMTEQANLILLTKAFELRGKLRRLAVASQAVLSASSSLIETQVAARDALYVMTKDAVKILNEVYPSRAELRGEFESQPVIVVGSVVGDNDAGEGE